MSDWESMAHALVAERYPRLLSRARMLVTSLAEAEDLVQEALVATFSKPRGFASMPQAEQYVRRAIVTTHLNAAKRGARERHHWQGIGAADVVPDHAGHVVGEADVAGILHGLAPRVRACIVLRYLEDLSIADTARALGLSEGAVKRYVSDGLRELNGRLGTHATVDDVVVVRVDVRPGGVA